MFNDGYDPNRIHAICFDAGRSAHPVEAFKRAVPVFFGEMPMPVSLIDIAEPGLFHQQPGRSGDLSCCKRNVYFRERVDEDSQHLFASLPRFQTIIGLKSF